jgi:hypothetical protein
MITSRLGTSLARLARICWMRYCQMGKSMGHRTKPRQEVVLHHGGLRIRTPLEVRWQRQAQGAVVGAVGPARYDGFSAFILTGAAQT